MVRSTRELRDLRPQEVHSRYFCQTNGALSPTGLRQEGSALAAFTGYIMIAIVLSLVSICFLSTGEPHEGKVRRMKSMTRVAVAAVANVFSVIAVNWATSLSG